MRFKNFQADLTMKKFTHIHVHSQYSILDGAADLPGLIDKTKELGMEGIALTDHGNMFGIKLFHKLAKKAGIKPILGCEAYVAKNHRTAKETKEDRLRDHLVLLAKNKTGYHNLIKMISYGFMEGYYYKPRIDKELLRENSEGIICSTACLGGEIPRVAYMEGVDATEKLVLEYKEIFGDDFYLEMQRHQSGDPRIDADVYERQCKVNEVLIEVSKRTGIKLIATNDVHFINAEDAEAHDRLICLNTGKDLDDPNRMRYTKQEYLKSPEEMWALFSDLPESCEATQEVFEKIEEYELDVAPIMPDFPLPDGFDSEAEYLRHITFEGAKMRWGTISPEQEERVNFELDTIINMGFPGYFLIVWDFIKAGREMGVSVGPGRGSAAGSAVAYCLRITEIDPIAYQLLFERFLNPDRVSMPDIDIDFDEDGREEVLKWVVNKYGEKRVAHIITFGTMAPKMAIKDVARVQKLELAEANRLAKLIPEKPGTTFKKAYKEVPELFDEKESDNELIASTIKYAEVLEGSVRQTGVHACGVIICRDDLEQHIPVCINKDAALYVTQYDGKHVEDVGMLKMDFLGLKTLSIIKDAVTNVKISKGIDIDIDKIPLDDKETFELYSRGETTALFQFESPGMKKHLKALKPNRFEDLIAMNALYRPGPMEYIPSFIARKHGKEEIKYDVPEMEEFLQDTYGITVYQEQVMLLSQKLAGFTKGMADSLRKAMGKKIKAMMDDLKVKFQEGCATKGYDPKVVEKIWKDWEAFAQYAFNKSHSTCYAYVSYQTGYMKAHYPAEFMAAVLSRNLSNIDKITIFMDECKRMGLSVLVPDVNESIRSFGVNKQGQIRFGLGAIKGVGDSATQSIIEEREKNGPYKDIYDFAARVNLRSVNKRNFECLAASGAFDSFGIPRYKLMMKDPRSEENFIEALHKYGNNVQSGGSDAPSLFGDVVELEIPKPAIPEMEASKEWNHLRILNDEKELVGIFLSAHPLDEYKIEMKHFAKTKLTDLEDLVVLKGRDLTIAGMVTNSRQGVSKNGKEYGFISLEDYSGTYELGLFGKDYTEFSKYMQTGLILSVKGTVDVKWRGSDELSFKIKEVEQMSEVKKKIKSISLKVQIDQITEELISEVNSFTEKDATDGLALRFLVYEPVDKVWVELSSKTCKMNLSTDLVQFLENNTDIEFKLN